MAVDSGESKNGKRAFSIADLERILRAIQPDLPQEPLKQMLTGLDVVVENQATLQQNMREIRENQADQVNVNFIGLVQVLPLRFHWIGILAFVMVNVLANTLTVAGLAAFLATVTGVTFKDDLDRLQGLVTDVRDGTLTSEELLNAARLQVDNLLNYGQITQAELSQVAATLERAALPTHLAYQHSTTLSDALRAFGESLFQAGFQ